MPSEMRRPDMPGIDHFLDALDVRLRTEVAATTRAIPPRRLYVLLHTLRRIGRPIAQSGAMALTGIAVIIAIGATPAANSGDLPGFLRTPVAVPSETALVESDSRFADRLPADAVLAVQKADIHDTKLPPAE